MTSRAAFWPAPGDPAAGMRAGAGQVEPVSAIR